VADHLAEFLETKTASDPCALGKAAYVSQSPALASSVIVNPPAGSEAKSTPAKREGHVSFGSGAPLGAINIPSSAAPAPPQRTAPVLKPTSNQPSIYRPPTVGTVQIQPGTTYTPPSPSTTTVGSVGTTTMQQGQTYTPPPAGTTTIPTTSTNPP
jgi:hypothetical protein